jgi:hypothetical protein
MRRVLVEFDFLGEVLGLVVDGSAVAVELPSGAFRSFVAGAEIGDLPHRSAPIIGAGIGDQSVSITLSVGVYQSWGLRRTAPIQLARCRVYWWPEGEVLRDEHELFSGIVRDPEWVLGPDGEGSVSFSVVPARRSDDVAFPPFLVGDTGRFTAAPSDALSYAVPVVYGAAKGLPLVAVSDVTVDPIRLLISCHRIQSSTVQIARGGVNVGVPVAVAYDRDGLGGIYGYCLISLANYTAGADLYLVDVEGWAEGGRAVDRLGDVMEHAFRTYGQASWYELDRPRVEAAKSRLNRLAVALFANERGDGTLMQFLKQRLGGQFPVAFSFAGGRLGWDAILFPRGSDLGFAVARITYGQDTFERVGPTETSADDVLTDIDLAYGYDGAQPGTTAALSFTPETSADSRRASTRWGRSPILSVDAPDIGDSDSAYVLLADIAIKSSRVRHRVEYHGLPESFYFLPLASIVEVTDPDLGWQSEPCIIEAVEPRKDGLVDLVLVTADGQ